MEMGVKTDSELPLETGSLSKREPCSGTGSNAHMAVTHFPKF